MVDDSWNRVYQDPNFTEVTKLKSVLTGMWVVSPAYGI